MLNQAAKDRMRKREEKAKKKKGNMKVPIHSGPKGDRNLINAR